MRSTKSNSGFTIIEVALVLAIAGLIFLVVFLALPALQKSQRDTARRQDVARIMSALDQYEADHGGDSPFGIFSTDGQSTDDFSGYVGKLSQITAVQVATEPEITLCWNDTADQSPNRAWLSVGCTCKDDTATLENATAKNAALTVRLESGSRYCANA